ncbi:Pyoverdine/dityrosine biosynthesis protein-domain-containing protein [Clohesyomyces aquaticus]|uniref:Pyoverdine/dityrosine biosynthesis protein-domain-containing protein n=1 Tax=Clohesyomyces aquaticus TaxID=1231657 RepID=A0A1Y1ZED2_9PLEO|nr:Pyoverdine/dityrosine biosynthesis protein-domain-containing protein [Clohesyomyces aquaticus]
MEAATVYSPLDDIPRISTDTIHYFDSSTLLPPTYNYVFQEVENFRLAFGILNILERYGRHIDPNTSKQSSFWVGKGLFLPRVYHHVRLRQTIPLTLPAFPCKSPNNVDKVLGHLPDLGEELALRRLNSLAVDIGRVYKPGAYVNIATDGILFNDILGVPDEICWEYGEALKSIIAEGSLTRIRLLQPMNLLGIIPGKIISRHEYLSATFSCRLSLERRFAPSEDTLTKAINNPTSQDTCLTYRGMLRFLSSDLGSSASLLGLGRNAKGKVLRGMARKMMQQSEAFTLAIRTLRPLDVRLSMHPSSGAVKLSIPLIPGPDGGFQKSPWHSCVVVGVNGACRMAHVSEVRDTHDLVFHRGQPWFYRERRSLVG